MRMNVLITQWHLQRGRVAVTPDVPPRRVLCSFNHSQPRHSPSMSCKVRCPAPKCRGSFPVGSWWVLRLYDLFSLCVMCRHFRGESWVFLLICSNPETGKQRLLSRTLVHQAAEQCMSGVTQWGMKAAASSASWGAVVCLGEGVPISQAVLQPQKLLSEFSVVPDVSHWCRVWQTLLLCSLTNLMPPAAAHSGSISLPWKQAVLIPAHTDDFFFFFFAFLP